MGFNSGFKGLMQKKKCKDIRCVCLFLIFTKYLCVLTNVFLFWHLFCALRLYTILKLRASEIKSREHFQSWLLNVFYIMSTVSILSWAQLSLLWSQILKYITSHRLNKMSDSTKWLKQWPSCSHFSLARFEPWPLLCLFPLIFSVIYSVSPNRCKYSTFSQATASWFRVVSHSFSSYHPVNPR